MLVCWCIFFFVDALMIVLMCSCVDELMIMLNVSMCEKFEVFCVDDCAGCVDELMTVLMLMCSRVDRLMFRGVGD